MYGLIVAGGEGTRLRPLTKDRPKPMVEVDGHPILYYQIRQMKKAGITDIVIAERYYANVIQDYFGDGSLFGVNITHLVEGEEKIGSAGVIKEALGIIPPDEDVVVMYGDIISELDLAVLAEKHREKGQPITLWGRHYTIPLGVLKINNQGIVRKIEEKPIIEVNTAVCIVNQSIRDMLPDSGDFYGDAVPLFNEHMFALVDDSPWWHITNEGDLRRADLELRERRIMREGVAGFGPERC